MGGQKEGEEGLLDCSEGEGRGRERESKKEREKERKRKRERDLSIADSVREPRLSVGGKKRLANFDRPCTREEWCAMSLQDKWRKLKVMKFSFHGQKQAKLGEDVTKAAPSSMKAPPPQSAKPPPAPPATFGCDRVETEGESREKDPRRKGEQRKEWSAAAKRKTITDQSRGE